MSDFIGDRECITHHHACDCREKMFRNLISEAEGLREALEYIRLHWADDEYLVNIAEQALKGDK